MDGAQRSIGQQERIEDARRCRAVMEGYRVMKEQGVNNPGQQMGLWLKQHKKHRGVHPTEITDLQLNAGLAVAEADARNVQMVKQKEMNYKKTATLRSAFEARMRSKFKSEANKRYYTQTDKAKAKARRAHWSKKYLLEHDNHKPNSRVVKMR